MSTYLVKVPYVVKVCVEVEADDLEDAIDIGTEEAYLEYFIGNGGIDKLVGVIGENLSVEPDDTSCEGCYEFIIECDIID